MGKILNRKNSIVIASLLACIFLAFIARVYFSTRTVQAFITPLVIKQGEYIAFSDSTQRAKEWLWDFGNGDTLHSKSGRYQYKYPGKYQVKLVVDHSIEKKIIVTVNEKLQSADGEENIKIIAPTMAVQEEYITFKGIGNDKEWRWEFGESAKIDSRDKTPIYAYREPGIYEILLSTESTRYPVRHTIEILPKYMENDSTDVFVLVGNDIREKLQAIVDGKPFNKNYSYVMEKYLCNNSEATVVVNNTKKNDFYSYCQGLRIIGRKKTVIDKVTVDVGGENGECVNKLAVTQYEK